MVRSAGTAGTHANHVTPEGVSALCDPHESEPWRADYVPFIKIPNSLVIRWADLRHPRLRSNGAFLARPTNGWTKTYV